MLEVLGKQLRDAESLGMRPEVSVEPRQLIGRRSPDRGPDQLVVREEHVELRQELLRFPAGLGRGEQQFPPIGSPGDGRDELDDRLVWQVHGPFRDSRTEEVGCDPLLLREPRIESIDEDVGVNQRCHAWRGPLASTRGHRRRSPRAPKRSRELAGDR